MPLFALERLVEPRALGRHLRVVELHRPVRGRVVRGVAARVVAGGGGVADAVRGEEHVARGEQAGQVGHQSPVVDHAAGDAEELPLLGQELAGPPAVAVALEDVRVESKPALV